MTMRSKVHDHNLPTDDELWAVRATFSSSTYALSNNHGSKDVRDALRKRGWDFDETAARHKAFILSPCKKCPKSFVIDDRTERLCDACQAAAAKTAVVEPWRENLERERQRRANR